MDPRTGARRSARRARCRILPPLATGRNCAREPGGRQSAMRRRPRSQPGRGASCSGPSQPREADEAPPAFRRRAGEGTERERVWWRRPSGGRGRRRRKGDGKAPRPGGRSRSRSRGQHHTTTASNNDSTSSELAAE